MTEIRTRAVGPGAGGAFPGVMETFYVLTGLVLTQVHASVKTHHSRQFQSCVNCIYCISIVLQFEFVIALKKKIWSNYCTNVTDASSVRLPDPLSQLNAPLLITAFPFGTEMWSLHKSAFFARVGSGPLVPCLALEGTCLIQRAPGTI